MHSIDSCRQDIFIWNQIPQEPRLLAWAPDRHIACGGPLRFSGQAAPVDAPTRLQTVQQVGDLLGVEQAPRLSMIATVHLASLSFSQELRQSQVRISP